MASPLLTLVPTYTTKIPPPLHQPIHTPEAISSTQKEIYSRELMAEEKGRRQEILSKTISINPRNSSVKLKFPFLDLYKFLVEAFAKHQTELEETVLIGGAAAYVVSKLEYADIDVCFYIGHQANPLDELQRKAIFDWIALDIKSFIKERLKALDIHFELAQIDQSCFQKKIFINKDTDAFSLFGLGDLELKFIYRKPRHNVSTSDGFQVSLTNGIRCINEDTFCDQEGFHRARDALEYRYFDVDHPQNVMNLPFRLMQKTTQGFVIRQSETIIEALIQLKKDASEQEHEFRFCKQFHLHQENHYPNAIIGKAADLLNWCYFLLQLENTRERHFYYSAIASSWLEGPKKSLLSHFAGLLKQDSELTKHLLCVIHGCFLFQWIRGNDQISAYPMLRVNEKPRCQIVIRTESLKYHLLIPNPKEIMIDFCRSLKILEETQQQLERETVSIDLSLETIMIDIGFQPYPKDVILHQFVESIETGPLAEVLRTQFKDVSARSLYQLLMQELDSNAQQLISFKQITSHLKHLLSEPIPEEDVKTLISTALHSLHIEDSPEYSERLTQFQIQLHNKTISDPVKTRWLIQTILYIVHKIDQQKLYRLYQTLRRLIECAKAFLPDLEYNRIHLLLLKNEDLLIDQFLNLFEKFNGQADSRDECTTLISSTLFALQNLKFRSKTSSEISLWVGHTIGFMNKIVAYISLPELDQQLHIQFKCSLEEVLSLKTIKEIESIATLTITLFKSQPKFLEPYSSLLFELANKLNHSNQSDLYLQLIARLGKNDPSEKVQLESRNRLLKFLSTLFLEKKPAKLIKQQAIAILKTLGITEENLQGLKETDFDKNLSKALSHCLYLMADQNLPLANKTLHEFKSSIPRTLEDQQDLWMVSLDLLQRYSRIHVGSGISIAYQIWIEDQFFISQHRPPADERILSTEILTLSMILETILSCPHEEEMLFKANQVITHMMEVLKDGISIIQTQDHKIALTKSFTTIIEKLSNNAFVTLIQKLLFINGTISTGLKSSKKILNPYLTSDCTENSLVRLLQIYTKEGNMELLQSLLEITLNFRNSVDMHLEQGKLEPISQAFDAISTSKDLDAIKTTLEFLQNYLDGQVTSKLMNAILIDLQLALISEYLNKQDFEEACHLFEHLLNTINGSNNGSKEEFSIRYGSTACFILKSLINGFSTDKKLKDFDQLRLLDCFTFLNSSHCLKLASPENRISLLTAICQHKQFIWLQSGSQYLKDNPERDSDQFSSLSENLLKALLSCLDHPDEATKLTFIKNLVFFAGNKNLKLYRILFEYAAQKSNRAYFNLIETCPLSNAYLCLTERAAVYSAIIQYLANMIMQSLSEANELECALYSTTLQKIWQASTPILIHEPFQDQLQEYSSKSQLCMLQLFGECPLPFFAPIVSKFFLLNSYKDQKKAAKSLLKGFLKIPVRTYIETFNETLCPVIKAMITRQLFDTKPKDLAPFLTLFNALMDSENEIDRALYGKIQQLFFRWIKELSSRSISHQAKVFRMEEETSVAVGAIYKKMLMDDRCDIEHVWMPEHLLSEDQAFTFYYLYYSKTNLEMHSIDELRAIIKNVIECIPKCKSNHLFDIRKLISRLITKLVALNTLDAVLLAFELRHVALAETIYVHLFLPNEPPPEELMQEVNQLHLIILNKLIDLAREDISLSSSTTENYVMHLLLALPTFAAYFPEKTLMFYTIMIDTLFQRGELQHSMRLMVNIEKTKLFDSHKEEQERFHGVFIHELSIRFKNVQNKEPDTKDITTIFQTLMLAYKLKLTELQRNPLTCALRPLIDLLIERLLKKTPSTFALHYAIVSMIWASQLKLFKATEHENEQANALTNKKNSLWNLIGDTLSKWVKCIKKKDKDVAILTKWFVDLYPLLITYIPNHCHEVVGDLVTKFDFSIAGSTCTLGPRLRGIAAHQHIPLTHGPLAPFDPSIFNEDHKEIEFPPLIDGDDNLMFREEKKDCDIKIEMSMSTIQLAAFNAGRISALGARGSTKEAGSIKTWEDILIADKARSFELMTTTVIEYLRNNKEITLADVEVRLRKENCHAYLVASRTGIPDDIIIKGITGRRCKYMLWISTELKEIALRKKYEIIKGYYPKESTEEELDAINLKNLLDTGMLSDQKHVVRM